MKNLRIKTGLLLLLCTGMSIHLHAQVEVTEKIILTGTNPNDRQVTGLAYPDSSNSAVSAAAVLSGKLIYDAAVGTDTLFLQFSPAPTAYTKGMTVNFKMPATNTSGVFIQVNDLDAKPLFKYVNQQIDSAELLADQTVSAIYDGINFQVSSRLHQPCPAGFVEVNERYCIQVMEYDSLTLFPAMAVCGNLNAKLCTWSEWYYACQKTSLGLINMNDNFEFVDDPANFQTVQQIRVAGSPDCTASASITTVAATLRTFRCCYYKR